MNTPSKKRDANREGEPKTPIVLQLKKSWVWAEETQQFVGPGNQVFNPFNELPEGAKLRPVDVGIVQSEDARRSEGEQELARYFFLTFADDTVSQEWVSAVETWPCVQSSDLRPNPSLPS